MDRWELLWHQNGINLPLSPSYYLRFLRERSNQKGPLLLYGEACTTVGGDILICLF